MLNCGSTFQLHYTRFQNTLDQLFLRKITVWLTSAALLQLHCLHVLVKITCRRKTIFFFQSYIMREYIHLLWDSFNSPKRSSWFVRLVKLSRFVIAYNKKHLRQGKKRMIVPRKVDESKS